MVRPQSRWGAFAVHLGISLLIFLALAGVILYCWFPGGLFAIAGGWEGIRIVAAVDLVLGPSLTLIVYNIAKPARELARDLGLIALMQLLCLGAGVYTVFHARPLAVVHVFDTFYTFNKESYAALGVDPDALALLPGAYPKLVYVEVPRDKKTFLDEHVKGILNGEKPLQNQVALYRELPRDPEEVRALLQDKDADKNVGCIRVDIETPYKTGSVCFDAVTARLSDFIED